MIKLPETKKEILKFIDSVSDLNSTKGIAFKEKANSDPNYRKIIGELKRENKKEIGKLNKKLKELNDKRKKLKIKKKK